MHDGSLFSILQKIELLNWTESIFIFRSFVNGGCNNSAFILLGKENGKRRCCMFKTAEEKRFFRGRFRLSYDFHLLAQRLFWCGFRYCRWFLRLRHFRHLLRPALTVYQELPTNLLKGSKLKSTGLQKRLSAAWFINMMPNGTAKSSFTFWMVQPIGITGECILAEMEWWKAIWISRSWRPERFLLNPFLPCERMFRTGDLARMRPDGNIKFLGRIGNQVKIRRYRIELEEIDYYGIRM